MRQYTVAVTCAVAFLAFTSTSVRSADCVESHMALTAESGEQYVRSCTQDKPHEQDVAERRQHPVRNAEPPAPAPAADTRLVTTRSAQVR